MDKAITCNLVRQGKKQGSCLVNTVVGEQLTACEITLKFRNNTPLRLIKSIHLSRPEHYLSIYQSGCNFSCLKCHSAEFSKYTAGTWYAPEDILRKVLKYEKSITYYEPREKATMFHAEDLCRACGKCLTQNERPDTCPEILAPDQIVFSPQGFGPARNIVAFTGGDITCQPEFYAHVTGLIKSHCENIHVLIETNGYGLTTENLRIFEESGVDSFWLDIKAYDDDIHTKLTGCSNKNILDLPAELKEFDFVFEVLSLFIPDLVETDQISKIAKLLVKVDNTIPFTLLAFFPAHKLHMLRKPTFDEMINTYRTIKDIGLENVRLGNTGIFVNSENQLKTLLDEKLI